MKRRPKAAEAEEEGSAESWALQRALSQYSSGQPGDWICTGEPGRSWKEGSKHLQAEMANEFDKLHLTFIEF